MPDPVWVKKLRDQVDKLEQLVRHLSQRAPQDGRELLRGGLYLGLLTEELRPNSSALFKFYRWNGSTWILTARYGTVVDPGLGDRLAEGRRILVAAAAEPLDHYLLVRAEKTTVTVVSDWTCDPESEDVEVCELTIPVEWVNRSDECEPTPEEAAAPSGGDQAGGDPLDEPPPEMPDAGGQEAD